MVMIMIKNRKKNSKDGLIESLENYLKNFFLKHYTFHFILHTIIADNILTFKDAEARDCNYFYARLKRFQAKNPGKISFQFSLKKMLFFSFHFA